MDPHWKELVPIDRFIVQMNGILHDHDIKALTSLYQPLIGSIAYSLYLTFWNELDINQPSSIEITHRTLMNMTQLDLSEIYLQRKKLEGIGLLKTYKKEDEQHRLFLYELQPPLQPEQFLKDDVLNIYLYSRLGKQKFLDVRKKFSKSFMDVGEFEAITATFNEAFESVRRSELMTSKYSEINEAINDNSTEKFVQRELPESPQIGEKSFDFDLLLQDISTFILPNELITTEIKNAIIRLAFVYSIEPLEMSTILQQAYMSHGELTVETLRKEAQKWYRFEFPKDMPALSVRTQPVQNQTMVDQQPSNPYEKLIKYFETISPKQLLEKYSNGSKPAAADLKVIEAVMFDQKLNPGVMNVLIDYVLHINDRKLIHGYIEKIASHWKRKNILTVEQAMKIAKEEHQKYQGWSSSKSQSVKGTNYSRKNIRKDKLPKWWQNTSAKSNHTKDKQAQVENDQEDTEQMLEEYLKGL